MILQQRHVKIIEKLIYQLDINDLKKKTENPFSAPMHKKSNINFEKDQADQTLPGRNLTLSKHATDSQ